LSSWNKQDAQHKRDFSGRVDYIFMGHGTNDHISSPVVTQAALGWLTAQRSVVNADTKIFITVPFGGFANASIVQAYQMYQEIAKDSFTFLLDLGYEGRRGLSGIGPSWQASDGVHPYVWRGGQLGSLLSALAASTGTTSTCESCKSANAIIPSH